MWNKKLKELVVTLSIKYPNQANKTHKIKTYQPAYQPNKTQNKIKTYQPAYQPNKHKTRSKPTNQHINQTKQDQNLPTSLSNKQNTKQDQNLPTSLSTKQNKIAYQPNKITSHKVTMPSQHSRVRKQSTTWCHTSKPENPDDCHKSESHISHRVIIIFLILLQNCWALILLIDWPRGSKVLVHCDSDLKDWQSAFQKSQWISWKNERHWHRTIAERKWKIN